MHRGPAPHPYPRRRIWSMKMCSVLLRLLGPPCCSGEGLLQVQALRAVGSVTQAHWPGTETLSPSRPVPKPRPHGRGRGGQEQGKCSFGRTSWEAWL